jgi:hypothetical protein
MVMHRLLPSRAAFCIGAAIALSATALLPQPASARFVQQGPKLVPTDLAGPASVGCTVAVSGDGNTALIAAPSDGGVGSAYVFTRLNGVWQQQQNLFGDDSVGFANQGCAVALSADGNTAAFGGTGDNGNIGATWVFTRSNGVWTQQGPKLVGSGSVGPFVAQGRSVALSADGNTLISGGDNDNANVGATWVFVRSAGVWTQQGPKLTASDSIGTAGQGAAVALSADGNTAVVGGPGDNSAVGTAWVFVRSAGMWTQQGLKLTVTDATGSPQLGASVALSTDGNTAGLGGPADGSLAGAAWVFTRSAGVWTQQGLKLVGTGAGGVANQGFAVALSGDGNTLVSGGPGDSLGAGAIWVFVQSSGMWTQQGAKLVGTGAFGGNGIGFSNQGESAAISADGKTIIEGGPGDKEGIGAAWIFARSIAATHDFNGDGFSDIAWRDNANDIAAWLMSGTQVLQTGIFGGLMTTQAVVGQRDFNGDGNSDILFRDTTTGAVGMWLLNGLQILQAGSVGTMPTNWIIVGTGDFNGDGNGDILWRDSNTGAVAIWLMNGMQILQSGTLGPIPLSWSVVGTGDFNGDGKTDILWLDTSGNVAIWLMNGLQVLVPAGLGQVATVWSVAGTGDFDGDGMSDIVWRDTNGNVAVWLMNGLQIAAFGSFGLVPLTWSIAVTGDFDGDGTSDILWRDSTVGETAITFMSGLQNTRTVALGAVPLNWTVQGLNAD